MRVEQIMTRGIELVPPEATVQEAATLMAEHDIGAVLVGAEQELQGILTDRDIIIRVVVEARDPAGVRVGEVMSSTLFTCTPDTELKAALESMDAHQVRRMPVMGEESRLLGIVARSDITRVLLGFGRDDPLPETVESTERAPQ